MRLLSFALLLAVCGCSSPEPDLVLLPLNETEIATVNEGMTDGCYLVEGRAWRYDQGGAYFVGALNGPGVKDYVGVWFRPDGSNALVWANINAKTFSEWGSVLSSTSADGKIAWQVERSAAKRLK